MTNSRATSATSSGVAGTNRSPSPPSASGSQLTGSPLPLLLGRGRRRRRRLAPIRARAALARGFGRSRPRARLHRPARALLGLSLGLVRVGDYRREATENEALLADRPHVGHGPVQDERGRKAPPD